jgi:manganese/zinc/iron transport system ATP- binding protein
MSGVDARSQEQILGVLSGLREQGKLVIVVHHDLRAVTDWFDAVALINMRLVAAGPTEETLTPDNLRRTYAGAVEVLDEVGRAVQRRSRTP